MEEWLRCNTCFRRMKTSSCVFYITGCDHVFCSYCIDGVSKQCPKCDTVGAGIIPVRETSSRQTMSGVESVSSHTKVLIQRPQFCRVQYLILSHYAEEMDKAYVELIKLTDQLIVSTKLSVVSQKRLKKDLAKYHQWPINVAPPPTNERNVPMTSKSTLDILTNNARSQVSRSRELSLQKSNHDRPSLEPKSEHFPKNAHRNGTEVPQTLIYDCPQPVERKSEYFPRNSQFQLKRLKKYHAEYRHLSTDDAPPTTNERNVPMTAKPTYDILSNNARSQVCGSRELPQKSNHDGPQLDVPKSEYLPKNAHRNGTEVPQTLIYDYPQPVERKSEYFPKNSQFQLKRLKKYHPEYRHLSTDDAPPTTNERNVPMTAKPTYDILSNNARSQVCGSKELPQKSNHDGPQLDVPKSEHFPKKAHRNGTEVPQTLIYRYPQPVGRRLEYLPKNSQPQLDKLKSEYSSNTSQPCHQSFIKRANPSNPSFKKRRVDENIRSTEQKGLPTEYSSASARLIDTSSLNYGQSKNCATKSFLPNLQPAGAELQALHLHNNRLIAPINHCDQQYQCTMAYAPENTQYRARAIINSQEVREPVYEQILYLCDRCDNLHYGQIVKGAIGIHENTVVHEAVKACEPR